MAYGARPLDVRGVRAIIERKMADFERPARSVHLRHLPPEPYFEVAAEDPDIRLALECGYLTELESELRDPVLVRVTEREVYTCPELATLVLSDEPPEIHRAFVEGAFFRKLFRFFVPATHEGGPAWEATGQVREIMQRHFAFQLVVTETILGDAA